MARLLTQVQTVGDQTLTFVTKDGVNHGLMTIERLGQKEFECSFENGLLSGKFIQYFASGHIESIINFKLGKKEGAFVFFYESGVKQMTGTYKNDKYHGVVTTYDEFGDVIKLEQFVNGRLHGKVVSFYPRNVLNNLSDNGVMEISCYENGLLHGNKTSFMPSGEVISVIPYSHGRPLSYGYR